MNERHPERYIGEMKIISIPQKTVRLTRKIMPTKGVRQKFAQKMVSLAKEENHTPSKSRKKKRGCKLASAKDVLRSERIADKFTPAFGCKAAWPKIPII